MPDPLDDAKSRVSMLKMDIVRLRKQLTPPPARTTLWDVVTEQAAGVAGGAVSSRLFGRTRIGSTAGRALIREQRLILRDQQMAGQRALAQTVVEQLGRELESVRSYMDERTRLSLVRALTEAANAQRADTVLRRSALIAERLLSYEPRSLGSSARESPSTDYLLLQELEHATRRYRMEKLSALDPNWWTQRVPMDVRENAERRKRDRETTWPWDEGRDMPLIHYVDFADYSKIISRKDNWRDAFHETFRDVEVVRAKLRELEPIRNDVAHYRELNRAAREKLRFYARDLLACIRR